MLTFAEFLTMRRAALGLSMTALAARLSVTPQYISLLESGKCNPSKQLQDRCARFFKEDIDYIRFLAQPMSEQQKRVLLRTPSVLPFLSRRARDARGESGLPREAIPADAEDTFIQQLLAPVTSGAPGDVAPFYHELLDLVSGASGHPTQFSAKARAWSQYYRALLRARIEGPAAVRADFESLFDSLQREAGEAYPDVLRLNVADSLSAALCADRDWERAGELCEVVARLGRLIENTDRALQGYERAAEAYSRIGRPDLVIRMYRAAGEAEDIPAPMKARLHMAYARLEYNLSNPEAAAAPVEHAVRIWRLRSLDVGSKTAQLVAAQVLGLHILVELARRDEARLWLGRIRSTLARVRASEVAVDVQERFAAQSDLESAAMMVQQGRWNHAWKNLDDVQRRQSEGRFTFDDADDLSLFLSRLFVLKARVALAQRRDTDARELIEQANELPPLQDAVRQYGRRSALRAECLHILERLEGAHRADAERRRLLDELDPDQHADAALRNLCGTDQIKQLRARIRENVSDGPARTV